MQTIILLIIAIPVITLAAGCMWAWITDLDLPDHDTNDSN